MAKKRFLPNFLSTSYTSEHAYINGREVRNVELRKTQKNRKIKVTGHINNIPVYYQNWHPALHRMKRGMTTLQSRRKRKTEKSAVFDKSLSKRK